MWCYSLFYHNFPSIHNIHNFIIVDVCCCSLYLCFDFLLQFKTEASFCLSRTILSQGMEFHWEPVTLWIQKATFETHRLKCRLVEAVKFLDFFFSFPANVKWDSNRLIPYTTCWILFIAVPDWISKKNCWTILVLPDINIASIIRKPHLARRTKPLTVLTWKHPPVHPPLNEPCIRLCTLHQYPQFPPSLVHRLVITCSQFLSLSLFRLHITYIFAYRLTFCLPSCANIYIPHKLCLVNISSMIPASSPTHPSFYILGFSFWSLCVVFSCMPFRVPFVSWIRSFFSICVSPAWLSHSLRFLIILLSCVFHIWKT